MATCQILSFGDTASPIYFKVEWGAGVIIASNTNQPQTPKKEKPINSTGSHGQTYAARRTRVHWLHTVN